MKYSLLLVLAYLTFSFPVSAETGESEPVSLPFQKVAGMPFVPTFKPGIKLKAGGKDINIRIGHNVPVVTDWNGDGKKDLIVGHYDGRDGNIKLYLNKGTDSKPVLASAIPIKAGGKNIRLKGR